MWMRMNFRSRAEVKVDYGFYRDQMKQYQTMYVDKQIAIPRSPPVRGKPNRPGWIKEDPYTLYYRGSFFAFPAEEKTDD
jgi:hypothetical protein